MLPQGLKAAKQSCSQASTRCAPSCPMPYARSSRGSPRPRPRAAWEDDHTGSCSAKPTTSPADWVPGAWRASARCMVRATTRAVAQRGPGLH
eukprot:scaffold24340_cov20-Tisochrysis_lutea.AAC.2